MKITIERGDKLASHTIEDTKLYDVGEMLKSFYVVYKLFMDMVTDHFDTEAHIHYTKYLLEQEKTKRDIKCRIQ